MFASRLQPLPTLLPAAAEMNLCPFCLAIIFSQQELTLCIQGDHEASPICAACMLGGVNKGLRIQPFCR